MYPELLRCAHVPLDVVTHAPGVRGTGAQREQSISVNPFIRLAKALLTFDHDGVEVLRQVKPLYLRALRRGRAVGEKGKRYAALAQLFKSLQRSGEETDKLVTLVAIMVRDCSGKRLVGRAEGLKGEVHDV